MNKTARNIGFVVLAAGVLYYPLMRLYRFIADKRRESILEPDHTDHHIYKMFAPSYRNVMKPHRRK